MHRHGPHPGRGRDFFFNAMTPRGHHPRGGWGGPGEWGDPRAMGGMRRRRMRRGDVRAALLVLLDEQPHTGYSAMEELERRSNGAWRPSPGSVYPTLQQLEDEGLIRQEAGRAARPSRSPTRARPTSPTTARSSANPGPSRPRASARSGSSCAG